MIELKDSPLVSIIIIAYNSSKYIKETLSSVSAQTYKPLEIIISDDGSTDDTVKICQAWIIENEDRFDRVKLVRTSSNSGIPGNCNRGINASSGQWFKILSGDDMLVNTCIENNINYINQNKTAKIIQSNCNYYVDKFEINKFQKTSALEKSEFYRENITAKEQNKLLLIKNRVIALSMFINKETHLSVGGYDERLRFIDDLPMWIKYTENDIKIDFLKHTTYNYRISKDSVTKRGQVFMSAEYARDLLTFFDIYKKNKISFVRAFRYEYGLKLIIYLNKKGLNKKGIFNYLLFKSVLKFIN
jgi:glycosyltransferase involved in cell wall biosynthesis